MVEIFFQLSQILPWYKSTPWLCNLLLATLMFAFQVSVKKTPSPALTLHFQAPIFWMFIEGIFIYTKVSRDVFSSSAPFHLYYLIGWGNIILTY